ncbi:MAG: SsrA-binding protein SmpB [Myxococcota bacterium]
MSEARPLSADNIRDLIVNRRASFEFFIEDRFEAGLSLLGSEVKSLRAGRGNLQEAYVRLTDRGAVISGLHISPYEQANRNNHEPLRERQLLLNPSEIAKLRKATREKGLTVVPLRLYLKGSWIKMEIAIAKGKKLHDKRHALKERTAKQELRRRGQ